MGVVPSRLSDMLWAWPSVPRQSGGGGSNGSILVFLEVSPGELILLESFSILTGVVGSGGVVALLPLPLAVLDDADEEFPLARALFPDSTCACA